MRQEEDASFGRTLVAVLGALVVASVVILFLARAIGEREASAADGTVAERTAPVGKVKVAGADTIAPARAASPGDQITGAGAGTPQAGQDAAAQAPPQIAQAEEPPDKGKTVYDTACVVCHQTGVGGAPKIGDKAAWGDRIKQGEGTLAEHAIKGFQGKTGMMPPKGGRTDLSDEEVKAAVSYMVGEIQ